MGPRVVQYVADIMQIKTIIVDNIWVLELLARGRARVRNMMRGIARLRYCVDVCVNAWLM